MATQQRLQNLTEINDLSQEMFIRFTDNHILDNKELDVNRGYTSLGLAKEINETRLGYVKDMIKCLHTLEAYRESNLVKSISELALASLTISNYDLDLERYEWFLILTTV